MIAAPLGHVNASAFLRGLAEKREKASLFSSWPGIWREARLIDAPAIYVFRTSEIKRRGCPAPGYARASPRLS